MSAGAATTHAATTPSAATTQALAPVATHAAATSTKAAAATATKPAAAATTKAAAATTAKVKATVPHPSTKVLKVKYQAQPNYYWCGPAATRNALSASGHNVTMASLARQMGTTEAGTNSAYDITAALNKVVGGKAYTTTELSNPTVTAKQVAALQRDVIATIDDNRAVVANVAGTATDAAGASHSYEGGHYIAVNGYRDNGRQVDIADSADPSQSHYWIDTTDLAQWIATRGYSH
ncbi:C39 family peptidase [Hamadaea tsunoensis]|uniref:C39 family peptidase n=1 Tax=Hamadaea tsunoensis TaxID=53368 RepID=UPI0009FC00AD